jgi:hypothetical protein
LESVYLGFHYFFDFFPIALRRNISLKPGEAGQITVATGADMFVKRYFNPAFLLSLAQAEVPHN